jgi:phosphoenolpyruvate-protein phosphotransferase
MAGRRPRNSETFSRSGGRKRATFNGIPVVPGVAMGHVHLKFRNVTALSDELLDADAVPRELDLLTEAVRLGKEQLLVARAKMERDIGQVEAMIFDTHIAILEDRSFLGKVRDEVKRSLRPVEVVVSQIVDGYYRAMTAVGDSHLRERAADIRDVGLRLLECLQTLRGGGAEAVEESALEGDEEERSVVFARELLPSDIPHLEKRQVAGVVTETGSERGHVAIMLRALGLPTVMGVEGLADALEDGDYLIIDGSTGTVLINPKPEQRQIYRRHINEFNAYKKQLNSEVGKPAVTTDGQAVRLMINIAREAEIGLGRLHCANGVGLYRTELWMIQRDSYPDEEEQYAEYTAVVRAAQGQSVTIRTLDLGPDKKLPYLPTSLDDNHELGRRSIRLMMEIEDYQMIQLRAILRAAVHGPVRLLFPFITSVEDIRMAKRMVRQAKRQLEERGAPHADIPIGMMVEVPAAALSLEKYVRDVQFFSVGTNDLVQYLCAADRNLPEVSPWYKAYNPGVLNVLRQVAEVARAHDKPLSICGEMAGDPFYTMFLVGIGVTELSMSPPQIPLVKKIIRLIDLPGARRLVDTSMQLSSTGQIREIFHSTVESLLGRDLHGWTRKDD